MTAPTLLQLPEDVLSNIFQHLAIQDIRNLILTCKTLFYFIIHDNALWKSIALRTSHDTQAKRLIIKSKVENDGSPQSWYNNCRISHNWCKGFFKSKVTLQHRINYMPWIKLYNSEVLLLTVGTKLHCYDVKKFPNNIFSNKLLWKLDVPQIVRNDIRTNDITRFKLNGDLLVCGNRDGSTAVYKVDNIRLQPPLVQYIEDCHNNGDVEVTAVELIRHNHDCYIVTASNDCSNVQFWHSNRERETREFYQKDCKSYMNINLDDDIGVRCLAVNKNKNKLAVGPNGNNRPLIIDTITGQLLLSNNDTKNRKQTIQDIHWHNENTVIYVTHSGHLQLLDVRNNIVVYAAKDPFQSTLYCVKTDGNRAFVAGSSEYSRCVLYDFCSPHHVQMYFTQKRSSPVYSLDFNASALVAAVDRGVAALNFDVLTATIRQRDYSDIFKS